MAEHRFKLETSDSGAKFLTVWYLGNEWQAAIDAGLDAYGLTNDQRARVQIIARPMPETAAPGDWGGDGGGG